MFLQIAELLWVGLRSIPQRWGSTSVVLIGVGGVVAVLTTLLAMAEGFEAKLQQTGRDDRALVLRAGSTSEINGNIPLAQYQIVQDFPQIKRMGQRPLISQETYVTVNLPLKNRSQSSSPANADTASATLRGVSEASYLVRNELSVVAGRKPEPGKYELLAGRVAAQQFANLQPGDMLSVRGIVWQVVGNFAAPGSAIEAELWTDERLLAQAWNRGETFSSSLVTLTSSTDFQGFSNQITNDPRLTMRAFRESDHFSAQAETTTTIMRSMAVVLGGIMALGALFAAITTMHAAISQRANEIACLRAIGFGNAVIVIALMLEAILLSLLAALAASALVYVLFEGRSFVTAAATSATFTQVAFKLELNSAIVALGVLLALALGLLGGLPPAIAACRGSIAGALRRGG